MALADVEQRLEASDVTLYMIGQGRGITLDSLKKILDRLARPTGGRALVHRQHRRAPRRVQRSYSMSCRTSIFWAISPTNDVRDNTIRRIKVRWTARTRSARGRATVPPRRNEADGKAGRCRGRRGIAALRAPRVSSSSASSASSRPSAGASRALHSPPRFRTSVEVTSIDVAVVDGQGKPLTEPRACRLHRAGRRQSPLRRERGMGSARRRDDGDRRRWRGCPKATPRTRARPAAVSSPSPSTSHTSGPAAPWPSSPPPMPSSIACRRRIGLPR